MLIFKIVKYGFLVFFTSFSLGALAAECNITLAEALKHLCNYYGFQDDPKDYFAPNYRRNFGSNLFGFMQRFGITSQELMFFQAKSDGFVLGLKPKMNDYLDQLCKPGEHCVFTAYRLAKLFAAAQLLPEGFRQRAYEKIVKNTVNLWSSPSSISTRHMLGYFDKESPWKKRLHWLRSVVTEKDEAPKAETPDLFLQIAPFDVFFHIRLGTHYEEHNVQFQKDLKEFTDDHGADFVSDKIKNQPDFLLQNIVFKIMEIPGTALFHRGKLEGIPPYLVSVSKHTPTLMPKEIVIIHEMTHVLVEMLFDQIQNFVSKEHGIFIERDSDLFALIHEVYAAENHIRVLQSMSEYMELIEAAKKSNVDWDLSQTLFLGGAYHALEPAHKLREVIARANLYRSSMEKFSQLQNLEQIMAYATSSEKWIDVLMSLPTIDALIVQAESR